MDPAGPVVLSVSAFIGAAVSGCVAGYGVYEVATGPPRYDDPSIKFVYSFQLVGCLDLLIPLVSLSVLLALAGALLLRYRRQLVGDDLPSAAGLRWVRRTRCLVSGGYVPGLVVVAGVASADQLFGTPRTASTVAGGAVGMLGFLVGWAGFRRASGHRWRLPLARSSLVGAVVAVWLAGAGLTRAQDEQNLLLVTKTPLSVGFHYLSEFARPSVRFMMLACAEAPDCVGVGQGTYYGPDPWAGWPLLGVTTNGGVNWSVSAFPPTPPNDTNFGRPNCGPHQCQAFLNGTPEELVTVSFSAHRAAKVSVHRLAVALGSSLGPACDGKDCLMLSQSLSGQAVAWRSTDDGAAWSRLALPVPRRPWGKGSLVGMPEGPWCTGSLGCTGALVVSVPACASRRVSDRCSHQLDVLRTTDGGLSWSVSAFPVGRPNLDPRSISCSPGGICTAPDLGGHGFFISGDLGAHWTGPHAAPAGAQGFYCWNLTSCVASAGVGQMAATTDGGETWDKQALPASPRTAALPVWCGQTGNCVADSQIAWPEAPLVFTRAGATSQWVRHGFPMPRPFSAGVGTTKMTPVP